jgi:hypothetical protein
VPKYNLVLVKRHDTFGGNGGDTKSGMYIRKIINARVSAPVSNLKLIPLELHAQQMDFVDIPETMLKTYQQQIALNGRTRKIEYTKYGLVFDEWFILHPVSDTRFYIEDFNKYMFFKFVNDKPIFDRID